MEEEKKRKKEKHQDGFGDGKEEREAKEDTSEGREEEAGTHCPCVSPDS